MNLNWSNAMSSAGGALGTVGLEGVRAQLDQQKIELASQLAEKRQVGAEQRAPGVAAATATATADANAASTVRNAPGLLDVEVGRKKALGAVDVQTELDKFKTLAPVKRQEEIDTAVAKVKALSSPEMLANARNIALASHIVDPSYTLIPNADGTVTTFDSKSGKSTGVVKDADGNPVVRKDPEEMKAAIAVINLANTNLRIAEAAYKADASSLEPGVKEKAAVTWATAQTEAKQLTAPAYAVLYGKAKIPGVSDAPAAPTKTGWDSATGEVFKDGEVIGKAKSAAGARTILGAPAAATKPAEEPTVHLPPGAPDPNEALNAQRSAARNAQEQKDLEEARQQRLRARAGDAETVGLMNTLAR